MLPAVGRSASARVARRRSRSRPAGSCATAADDTGRYATASRARPARPRRAAARHAVGVRLAVAALRRVPSRVRGRSSWTGSIPSTAPSSRASACWTPAAAPAGTRTCVPLRRPGGRRRRPERRRRGRAGEPRAARQRHVVQGDLLRLPLRDAAEGGGFDLIYSIGVLHHLPTRTQASARGSPICGPGGTIAVVALRLREQRLRAARRRAPPPVRRRSCRAPRCAPSPGRSPSRSTASRRACTDRSRTRVPGGRSRWTSTCRAWPTSASARTTALSSTSSPLRPPRTSRARSSRAGSRRPARGRGDLAPPRQLLAAEAGPGRRSDVVRREDARTHRRDFEVESVARLRVNHDHPLRLLPPAAANRQER